MAATPGQRSRRRDPGELSFGAQTDRGGVVEFPEDLRYTKEHEWVRVEGTRARVGITDFAQDALGDVVYVDLPEVGAVVQAAQPLGEVESTKSVSDVYSPVSGTIAERNGLVDDRPELVNEQPYGDGWLVVIDPEDIDAVGALLDAAAYRSLVDGDG
jgi:glycine cleavage system H protein